MLILYIGVNAPTDLIKLKINTNQYKTEQKLEKKIGDVD